MQGIGLPWFTVRGPSRSAELRDMGGSIIDLLDGTEDHRRGALDRPAHQVPRAVAAMYFGEPLVDRHELAVWACGHVTEGQHAGKRVRRWLELAAQQVGESAFAGFDDGAGMMGDQPAQQGAGMLGVAQVPGAIELMQARERQAGGVADVVQPRGGFQQVGISAENGRQAAGSGSDALDVRPAAGERLPKERLGQLSGP